MPSVKVGEEFTKDVKLFPMDQESLFKIKQFIRVSRDIEAAFDLTALQRKILMKLIDLCNQDTKRISVGELAASVNDVSERSVYRHIKALVSLRWIKLTSDHKDHRVKFVTPTPRLLKILSAQI